MIPLHLRISGFLSYRDPVELDFNTFDLACISGQNGAGKSSLLDAITWSLFGEARGKSSDVIHLHAEVKAAEVALIFEHEGNTYRVQRTLPRGKSTVLEFQVLSPHAEPSQNTPNGFPGSEGSWKPLTEKTTRETQSRLEQTLRLDYETFVNASFFLQGRADQFTQQNAGKRKEVLSNILGLEIWEEYKNRTVVKRKQIEAEAETIEGRIAEIDSELAEEEARTIRLGELQRTLGQLSAAREAQESILQNLKRNAALLEEQRKLASTLSAGLDRTRAALTSLAARLSQKEADRAAYADLVQRAKDIESAYQAWQKARKDLETLDRVASEFHGHQSERAALQERIAVEKAKLEEERRALSAEQTERDVQKLEMKDLDSAITISQGALQEAERKIKERTELENQRSSAREQQAALKVENDSLKADMTVLKDRIETLKTAEGATCPLCGQELSTEHRKATLKQLEEEGKQKGDDYRANQKKTSDLGNRIADLESHISALASVENDRVKFASEVSQLSERLDTLKSITQEWEAAGKKRLKELDRMLEGGKYAAGERKQLAKLDKELAKLGYDTSAHDAARELEAGLRNAEDEYVNLKSAREVSLQIDGEIANLESEMANRRSEIEHLEADYLTASASLESAESHLPDLDQAERELFRLREEENKTRGEMGGAQQRVEVLKTQRARKAEYAKERDELGQQIARHRTLETAFGKNGVPALLIEQALPQIEEKANELLDRLSDGGMSIRFVTQAEYRDKKRDDLKETLDIQISDAAGIRNYEMYSGGEAFRVNFAIRLALSEILAQRKGARLQTLVIDEGFGSQDTQGRQRLIEAINLVKPDFAKILIITHLDELKDAFPTRIEVEKTERGSTLRVL